eukprot:94914_1
MTTKPRSTTVPSIPVKTKGNVPATKTGIPVIAPTHTPVNCQTEVPADDDKAPVDNCAVNPCENEGKCTSNEDGYTCDCPDTHTGKNCQTEVPADDDKAPVDNCAVN